MYLHKGFRLGGAVSKVMPIVHVLSKLGLLFSLLLAVPTLMSYFLSRQRFSRVCLYGFDRIAGIVRYLGADFAFQP